MKKIIVPLIALVAVIAIFLFSCHKEEPTIKSSEMVSHVVVEGNTDESKDNFKNDSGEKNDVLDNIEDSAESGGGCGATDNELPDSENVKNASANKDNPKNNTTDKKPNSDSNKTETVKPNIEKPSSNTSKPDSTTQKPSSTSKPSDSTPDNTIMKPSDSNSSNTNKPEFDTSKPTETKPNNNGSTSSNQSNNSGASDKTESKPIHSHKWTETYRTVSHKEEREDVWVVDIPAYTEEFPVYTQIPKTICNSCKAELTKENVNSHTEAHLLAGDMKAGWHTEFFREQTGTEIIEHEEEGHWESIVVKEAYTEQVLTGYQCECGETKSL